MSTEKQNKATDSFFFLLLWYKFKRHDIKTLRA